MTTEFILTKEYKRFLEFCKACEKDKYIGLCYGIAGVGKSLSARHYAKWDRVCEDIMSSAPINHNMKPSLDMSSLSTIIYTPEVQNSPRAMKNDIEELMYLFSKLKERSLCDDGLAPKENNRINYVQMLIVDEADRLQPKSLEQVRDLYDRYDIGLILIGMPGIEKRLIRFPQLYSRVGFIHAYKPLCEEEIKFILQNHCRALNVEIDPNDFSDHETIAAITRITHGNFRLINRLLKQASRIMAVNQLSSITKEVIEAARECLVIGNIN